MFKFVKRQFEVVLKICASPSAVAPEPYFLSPRGVSRGVSLGTPSRAKRGMPRYRSAGRRRELFGTASETIKAPSRNLFKTFHFRGAGLGA